jgi:hypothetical protein
MVVIAPKGAASNPSGEGDLLLWRAELRPRRLFRAVEALSKAREELRGLLAEVVRDEVARRFLPLALVFFVHPFERCRTG